MKLLHLLKSEPDDTTQKLMDAVSEGNETTVEKMYEGEPDYTKIIRLVFENDKNISWW
ncbi:MAG: hypothetical protein HY788_05655 [Deltaproteobacteria bacterium]|nr:hypothetical protein [Deltaproteobacteria bacterium]